MRQINLRGQSFYIHDNEDLSNAIARNGDYWEADILDYLAAHYPYHKTILDIGANIGNHSVYFGRYLKAEQIYCFEPDELNFKLLEKNISFLHSQSLIYLYKLALSYYTGYTYIQRNVGNWGAHQIADEGEIKIRCVALDDYISLDQVTLMKIDVEWAEPKVLLGARNTIQRNKPLILIEDSARTYDTLQELEDYHIIREWDQHRTYLYGAK